MHPSVVLRDTRGCCSTSYCGPVVTEHQVTLPRGPIFTSGTFVHRWPCLGSTWYLLHVTCPVSPFQQPQLAIFCGQLCAAVGVAVLRRYLQMRITKGLLLSKLEQSQEVLLECMPGVPSETDPGHPCRTGECSPLSSLGCSIGSTWPTLEIGVPVDLRFAGVNTLVTQDCLWRTGALLCQCPLSPGKLPCG